MLDICLLGTGGMMPLPYRWLTSMMARCEGVNLLIDCGEGTQVAIKEKGWSPKPIDVICFTHFHADHISGLPGLLLTIGNCEKTTPLLIIGPKGLERVVNAMRVIAPELPFEIQFHELRENEEVFEYLKARILIPTGLVAYRAFYPHDPRSEYGFFKDTSSLHKNKYIKEIFESVKLCEDFNLVEFAKIMVNAVPTYLGYDDADCYISFLKIHVEGAPILRRLHPYTPPAGFGLFQKAQYAAMCIHRL